MIIVEGSDGSGKTSLAHLIKAYHGFNIIHSPGKIKKECVQERRFWCDTLTQVNNVILDRCYYFSEYIYGPILRNKSLITLEDINDFLKFFGSNKNHLLIYCEQELMHKEESDFDKKVSGKLEIIRKAYKDLFEKKLNLKGINFYKVNDFKHCMSLMRYIGSFYECKGL